MSKPPNPNLGKNIRKRRELLGVRQKDLANNLGISVQTISNIELGNQGTTLKVFEKLEKELKYPTHPLFK